MNLPDLARSIASGTAAMLPKVEHELYDFDAWHNEAVCALEAGDFTEMAHMLAREEMYQDFKAWERVDYERRQYADFGTWLSDRLFPSEQHNLAMTFQERKGVAA